MTDAARREYLAKIVDVFSGDDLIVMVDLGAEDLYKRQRIRLHGVDTPNAIGAGPDTEAGKVRAYVRSLVRDKTLNIKIQSKGANSWVAVVEVQTPEGVTINLNEELVNQGYAFKRKG